MTQNLLLPNASSACANMRSRCLLRYVAIVPLKLLFASKVERAYVQICYFKAIARIDFVSIYGLLNDLLW